MHTRDDGVGLFVHAEMSVRLRNLDHLNHLPADITSSAMVMQGSEIRIREERIRDTMLMT